MTGEERVEEMVEVGTEGDGGEVGRSLGFGVPASKRGTITTGWTRGGKSLFHFRGRQSVRRRGRCGLRRPCQRPGGEISVEAENRTRLGCASATSGVVQRMTVKTHLFRLTRVE